MLWELFLTEKKFLSDTSVMFFLADVRTEAFVNRGGPPCALSIISLVSVPFALSPKPNPR